MNISSEEQSYRYERKFLVKDLYTAKDIEQMLRFHPACFKELYHERWINNIYFETPGFTSYYDNIEGERERWKTRIRWYGELFGTVAKPKLEFKIKKGLLGKKESYRMADFVLDNSFRQETLDNIITASHLPQHIETLLRSLKPVLLNRYKRKYFMSADKNFRVTVDSDLTYYSIFTAGNKFLNRSADRSSVVVEVKYAYGKDVFADSISNDFPFMLTKSSKYLMGIERVLM